MGGNTLNNSVSDTSNRDIKAPETSPMFPPETYDTGNSAVNAMLNGQSQNMKNEYNTGNAAMDKKLNDSHRQGLEKDEERGKHCGLSGKEIRETDAAIKAFQASDEGKDAFEKWSNAQKAAEGKAEDSPERAAESAAWRELHQKEKDYIKNNFNDRTFQNYCQRQDHNKMNPLNYIDGQYIGK